MIRSGNLAEDLGEAAHVAQVLRPTAPGPPIQRSIFDLDLEEATLLQELLMSEKIHHAQSIADPRLVGLLMRKKSTDLDLEGSLHQVRRRLEAQMIEEQERPQQTQGSRKKPGLRRDPPLLQE